MTTLESLGTTFLVGSFVGTLTFIGFGIAEYCQSTNIAPRCTARHPNTIYNREASSSSKKLTSTTTTTTTTITNSERKDVQWRGWPMVGWIGWVMSLSYDTMLKGVPGTGTRKRGLAGRLLTINLDAILLIRFHEICTKVTMLACVLGLCVCLPMYWSSPCYNMDAETVDELRNCTTLHNNNLTNFELTTLKNIPPLNLKTKNEKFQIVGNLDISSISARLYTVVICTYILVFYTLYLIKKEWISMLAMRRVYYLENAHWEQCTQDLEQILTLSDDDEEYLYEDECSDDEENNNNRKNSSNNNNNNNNNTPTFNNTSSRRRSGGDGERMFHRDSEETLHHSNIHNKKKSDKTKKINNKKKNRRKRETKERDVWIPHPEQRETVPNIELYSVLVGGLPSLPKDVLDGKTVQDISNGNSRSMIDWQLELTSTLFDHCVPNQPGFSSSVAAVTILPDAHTLALAWRRWFALASALRRLKFIRRLMAHKKHYVLDDIYNDDDNNTNNTNHLHDIELVPHYHHKTSTAHNNHNYNYARNSNYKNEIAFLNEDFSDETNNNIDNNNVALKEEEIEVYQEEVDKLQLFYQRVFNNNGDLKSGGNFEEEDVETLLLNHFNFGPEQSAVYTRELAQSAAACCPYGCHQERLANLGIDELECLEKDCSSRVKESYHLLQQARSQAVLSLNDQQQENNDNDNDNNNDNDNDNNNDNDNDNDKDNMSTPPTNNTNIPFSIAANRNQEPVTTTTTTTKVNDGSNIENDLTNLNRQISSSSNKYSNNNKNNLHRRVTTGSFDPNKFPEKLETEAQLMAKKLSYSHNNDGFDNTNNNPSNATSTVKQKSAPAIITDHHRDHPTTPPPSSSRRKQHNSTITTTNKANSIPNMSTTTNTNTNTNTNNNSMDPYSNDFVKHPPNIPRKSDLSHYNNNNNNFFEPKTPSPDRMMQQQQQQPLLNLQRRSGMQSSTSSAAIGLGQSFAFASDGKFRLRTYSNNSIFNNDNQCIDPNHTNYNNNHSYNMNIPLDIQQQQQYNSMYPTPAANDNHNDMNSGTSSPTLSTQTNTTSRTAVGESRHQNFGRTTTTNNNNNYVSSVGGGSSSVRESPATVAYVRTRLNSESSFISRRRLNTDSSITYTTNMNRNRTRTDSSSDRWKHVENIVKDTTMMGSHHVSDGDIELEQEQQQQMVGSWRLKDGSYQWRKGWLDMKLWLRNKWREWFHQTKKAVDDFGLRHSTYAVVTFTSRQAAVAARHCLADARGRNRWLPVQDIPVPPLADAAPFDFVTCRNCCRPVTLSIHQRHKSVRKIFSTCLLATMFVMYSIPITFTAQLASIDKLYDIWPEFKTFIENYTFFRKIAAGIVQALLFILFFALCPVIFKAIANFGSNAVSVNQAEYCALKYYWWFMLFTAFAGTALGTMVVEYFSAEKRTLSSISLQKVFFEVAGSLPGTVSANWINWIIIRSTVTLPLQYMLQVNTFMFQFMGWRCCQRCVMGGGPGGHTPYRIYIDSGVVFLCVVALSPTSPLVAPVSLLYFLYCTPLWRRNCIFIYRPKFDNGGLRWPFLSDVCITSMIVGQSFLVVMMFLKEAYGASSFAAISIGIILYCRSEFRNRYLRAFLDVSLLQTSLLDGWDTIPTTDNTPYSYDEREEFRRFLVDSHKAAYIPICIAGDTTSVLTVEPAVTITLENEILINNNHNHNMAIVEVPNNTKEGAIVNNTSTASSVGGSIYSRAGYKIPSALFTTPPGNGGVRRSAGGGNNTNYNQVGVSLRRCSTNATVIHSNHHHPSSLRLTDEDESTIHSFGLSTIETFH